MARTLAASSRSRVVATLLLGLTVACGDDDGTSSDGNSGSSSSGGADLTSSTGSAPETGDSTAGGSSSGVATSESSGDDTTGAPAGDPIYPPPDGGCPGGTTPITLPGGELCAPPCGGPDDSCPEAATGGAPPQCFPFLGPGGSGAACDESTPCADPEVCSPEGSCSDVAFWACQLLCGAGQPCPDGMSCTGFGTCGY